MAVIKYRIKSSTIALFPEGDRHVARTIPEGSIIGVDSETFDGNKLVIAMWDEKKVMMFTQDVRFRGERIDGGKTEERFPGFRF